MWRDVGQRLLDNTCSQRTGRLEEDGCWPSFDVPSRLTVMAPKHHPTPLSGGDRKALSKELGRSRAITAILAAEASEARAKGEALIRKADKLLCNR